MSLVSNTIVNINVSIVIVITVLRYHHHHPHQQQHHPPPSPLQASLVDFLVCLRTLREDIGPESLSCEHVLHVILIFIIVLLTMMLKMMMTAMTMIMIRYVERLEPECEWEESVRSRKWFPIRSNMLHNPNKREGTRFLGKFP